MCLDWQNHTALFYSREDDTHVCTSITGPTRTIPFCATGCNSQCIWQNQKSKLYWRPLANSLVAVGDEEGRVRLIESAKDPKSVCRYISDNKRAWPKRILSWFVTGLQWCLPCFPCPYQRYHWYGVLRGWRLSSNSFRRPDSENCGYDYPNYDLSPWKPYSFIEAGSIPAWRKQP